MEQSERHDRGLALDNLSKFTSSGEQYPSAILQTS